MVAEGKEARDLRAEGFDEEAVAFAERGREKSKAQLEREGWDEVAVDFLLDHSWKSRAQMEGEGVDAEAIEIVEKQIPLIEECKAEVMRWHGDQDLYEQRETEAAEASIRGVIPFETHIQSLLWERVKRNGFDHATLQYFAGSQRFVTERDLARDGVEVEAMGQTISSQPYEPLPEKYADPWDLETQGVVTQANRASRRLWLGLKYWDGMPVLRKARMISKPKKRLYLSAREIGGITRGKQAGEVRPLGQVGEVMAVSTDLGVLEVRECVEKRVGGMPLCRIW